MLLEIFGTWSLQKNLGILDQFPYHIKRTELSQPSGSDSNRRSNGGGLIWFGPFSNTKYLSHFLSQSKISNCSKKQAKSNQIWNDATNNLSFSKSKKRNHNKNPAQLSAKFIEAYWISIISSSLSKLLLSKWHSQKDIPCTHRDSFLFPYQSNYPFLPL